MVSRRGPKIVSEKKEVSWSNLTQNAATVQTVTIYQGEPFSAVNLGNEIAVGQIVKWVYVEFNVSPEDIGTTAVFHWQFIFVPDGMTVGAPNTYNQGNKSYIVKRGMEMLVKDVGTEIKRVFTIRVPKSYQRVKVNTQLQFQYISSSSQTINTCGFTICKPTN